MTIPADIAAWRAEERKRLLVLRAAIDVEERRAMDGKVTDALVSAFAPLAPLALGFYWPMKGEFDPRVAVLRFREHGARAALPIVIQKAAPLEYREWWPGIETKPGVFGLPIPQGSPVVIPDMVLMPPVGFDARGYRLGYGGGYFDRTLASLSPQPLKIGVAREASQIETIHPQPHDVPMDFVITERGIHEVTADGRLALLDGHVVPRRRT